MSSFRFKNMVVSLLPESGQGAQLCAYNTFRTTTVCVLHTTVTFCHFGCSIHLTPICHYGCTHITPITCHFGCSIQITQFCHFGCTNHLTVCQDGCSNLGPSIGCLPGTMPPGGCGPASPYEGGLGQMGDPVEELTALRKGLDELLQNLQKMDQPQTRQDLDNLESNLNEALQEVRQRKENLNQGGNQTSGEQTS